MDIIALCAALTVAAAIVTGLMAVYQATATPRSGLERRLGNILGEGGGFEIAAAEYEGLRHKREGIPFITSLIQGKSWVEESQARLERADMSLTVSEFVALRFFLALILGGLPLLFFGFGAKGVLFGLPLILVGFMLPNIYVSRQISGRINKLNSQLVETLSLLSNSLKAGFGLMQSLELASRELPHPISTEIKRTMADINVGAATEEALQAMAKRSGSTDLDIVITAMLIQQSTGGNLSEILDNVGHTMRERIRIRGEISTLTTQQLMTGFIIGGLPFVIGGFISVLNPSYIAPLFSETAGYVMLAGAGFLELIGMILIKRILAIEV